MADKGAHSSGQARRLTLLRWLALASVLTASWWFYFHYDRHQEYAAGAIRTALSTGLSGVQTDRRQSLNSCDPSNALLKVYMYDMPPEFHFGMLGWTPSAAGNIWPDIRSSIPHYPGGLNLQHSVEYWLTLDLLSSTLPGRPGPCTAVRVNDSGDADLVFVPFFSSLSYNRFNKASGKKGSRNRELQRQVAKYLFAQDEWQRTGGRNHVVMAHHPNSMMDARHVLFPALFILSDFGRYHPKVANLEKDLIAPYRHMIATFTDDAGSFEDRPTLLYFRGAIYRKEGGNIRQELFYLLRNESDVEFEFGNIQSGGVGKASRGMRASKFCLNIAGDTPSSNRLFDAIVSHCVPVIISDSIELPYEDVLDYSQFAVFVRSADAVKEGYLLRLIRGIDREEWTRMWRLLKEVDRHFEYEYPSREGDAVQMIWQALARRVPAIRQKIHKAARFTPFEGRS